MSAVRGPTIGGWAVFAGALAVGGCLSYDQFVERKNERQCEEQANCNPGIDCVEDTAIDPDDCDFDRSAAHECLTGTWTCDDRFVGFEVPIPPQACDAVCRPATTGSSSTSSVPQ
ncbi:MAG: hypothetical protein ABMB14_22990 [Myxococcota bacterium]